MTETHWAYGTPEGLAAIRRAELAALTPSERLDLVEDLLLLMQQSGALARLRDAKQQEIDVSWSETA